LTIVYADTSALLKRVLIEPQSDALRTVLRERHDAGDVLASSSLAWLEVYRSLRRLQTMDLELLASSALSGIVEIPLTEAALTQARRVGPETLRSLDAIHLTAAVAVGATSMLTYDDRLGGAANLLGFEVLAPRT
jgi:predicted nucleic acid-binding protein